MIKLPELSYSIDPKEWLHSINKVLQSDMFLLKRHFKFLCQKLIRGFGNDELWNLNDNLVDYILPRIVAFRSGCASYPMDCTPTEWEDKLDKIVTAFALMKYQEYGEHNDQYRSWVKKNQEQIDEGLQLFSEYFENLWD